MTTAAVVPTTDTAAPAQPVVAVRRRTVDRVLIALGGVAAIVLAVAGGLLMWGSNFAHDYVHRELSSQNIVFPSADELSGQGRSDLVGFADEQVTTGNQAEAYASFINGHLQAVADGATYADSGPPRTPPRPTSKPPRTTAPAPPRSPPCRPRSTRSAANATPCSRVRRCAVCCCRATPGQRSVRSPGSPRSSPSSPPR